jgi:hypothetical protein
LSPEDRVHRVGRVLRDVTVPETLAAMLGNSGAFDTALADGRAELSGDPQALRLLLQNAALPPLAVA